MPPTPPSLLVFGYFFSFFFVSYLFNLIMISFAKMCWFVYICLPSMCARVSWVCVSTPMLSYWRAGSDGVWCDAAESSWNVRPVAFLQLCPPPPTCCSIKMMSMAIIKIFSPPIVPLPPPKKRHSANAWILACYPPAHTHTRVNFSISNFLNGSEE